MNNNAKLNCQSKNTDKSFVLLFGGAGCERGVSLEGAYNFLKTARGIGLDVLPVFVSEDGSFYIFEGDAEDVQKLKYGFLRDKLVPTFPVKLRGESGFLKDGKIVPVRLVFPLLHGDFGEDGVIQGLLTCAGIDFVGADNFSGAVTSDKEYSKIIARSVGVPALPETVFTTENFNTANALEFVASKYGFPVFIKPVRLGSSIGASLAESKEKFAKCVENAFLVSKKIMIEPALLNKRELECAYYKIGENKIITPPGEVAADGRFYDFNLKYSGTDSVKLFSRAELDTDIARKVIRYTDMLADAFDVRHIARFDYFLTPDGELYFNEVNTLPGMTGGSLYAAMLEESGMSFEDFISSIWQIGL